MLVEVAVPDVEGFVIDQESQDLAIGDVDDRLAVLGVTETRLGIRQRSRLVERVELRTRNTERLALVEIAT